MTYCAYGKEAQTLESRAKSAALQEVYARQLSFASITERVRVRIEINS